MENSIKNYQELSAVQDAVVELQKKVQSICSDMLHCDNFVVAAHFKTALMSAMCEMNEVMLRYDI